MLDSHQHRYSATDAELLPYARSWRSDRHQAHVDVRRWLQEAEGHVVRIGEHEHIAANQIGHDGC